MSGRCVCMYSSKPCPSHSTASSNADKDKGVIKSDLSQGWRRVFGALLFFPFHHPHPLKRTVTTAARSCTICLICREWDRHDCFKSVHFDHS